MTLPLQMLVRFGDALMCVRRELGMSAAELGAAIGKSDAYVMQVESGTRLVSEPEIETLMQVIRPLCAAKQAKGPSSY